MLDYNPDRIFMKTKLISTIALIASLLVPSSVQAFSLYPEGYQEDRDGDLSNDGATPTMLGSLTFAENSNFLRATFSSEDPDYFTFTVPEKQVLTAIELLSWDTEPVFDDIAFIAMQEGTIFDFMFPNTNPEQAEGLLGWSHLRSTQVGTDKILKEMAVSGETPESVGLDLVYQEEAASNPYEGLGLAPEQEAILLENLATLAEDWKPGAEGFDFPLRSGEYSIWLRQGLGAEMTVELNFITASVPEPGTILGLVTVLGFAGFNSRKKRN